MKLPKFMQKNESKKGIDVYNQKKISQTLNDVYLTPRLKAANNNVPTVTQPDSTVKPLTPASVILPPPLPTITTTTTTKPTPWCIAANNSALDSSIYNINSMSILASQTISPAIVKSLKVATNALNTSGTNGRFTKSAQAKRLKHNRPSLFTHKLLKDETPIRASNNIKSKLETCKEIHSNNNSLTKLLNKKSSKGCLNNNNNNNNEISIKLNDENNYELKTPLNQRKQVFLVNQTNSSPKTPITRKKTSKSNLPLSPATTTSTSTTTSSSNDLKKFIKRSYTHLQQLVSASKTSKLSAKSTNCSPATSPESLASTSSNESDNDMNVHKKRYSKHHTPNSHTPIAITNSVSASIKQKLSKISLIDQRKQTNKQKSTNRLRQTTTKKTRPIMGITALMLQNYKNQSTTSPTTTTTTKRTPPNVSWPNVYLIGLPIVFDNNKQEQQQQQEYKNATYDVDHQKNTKIKLQIYDNNSNNDSDSLTDCLV